MTSPYKIYFLVEGEQVDSNLSVDDYDSDYLERIKNSYDPKLFESPVVIGHDEDIRALYKNDKAPAYGWVKEIGLDSKGLYAITEVAPELSELIDKEVPPYRYISAAIYEPNNPFNPTEDEPYLRHIAFLGGQPPAIKGLPPVAKMKTYGDNLALTNTSVSFNKKNIKTAMEKRKINLFADGNKVLIPEADAPKEEISAFLEENARDFIIYVLQSGELGYAGEITGFDPEPSAENNYLFNIEENKFEGVFFDDASFELEGYNFEIFKRGDTWISSYIPVNQDEVQEYSEEKDVVSNTKELYEKTRDFLLAAITDKDNGGYEGSIDRFDPEPSEDNNYLYDIENKKFSGLFFDESSEEIDGFEFEIVFDEDEQNWKLSYLPALRKEDDDKLELELEEADPTLEYEEGGDDESTTSEYEEGKDEESTTSEYEEGENDENLSSVEYGEKNDEEEKVIAYEDAKKLIDDIKYSINVSEEEAEEILELSEKEEDETLEYLKDEKSTTSEYEESDAEEQEADVDYLLTKEDEDEESTTSEYEESDGEEETPPTSEYEEGKDDESTTSEYEESNEEEKKKVLSGELYEPGPKNEVTELQEADEEGLVEDVIQPEDEDSLAQGEIPEVDDDNSEELSMQAELELMRRESKALRQEILRLKTEVNELKINEFRAYGEKLTPILKGTSFEDNSEKLISLLQKVDGLEQKDSLRAYSEQFGIENPSKVIVDLMMEISNKISSNGLVTYGEVVEDDEIDEYDEYDGARGVVPDEDALKTHKEVLRYCEKNGINCNDSHKYIEAYKAVLSSKY